MLLNGCLLLKFQEKHEKEVKTKSFIMKIEFSLTNQNTITQEGG